MDNAFMELLTDRIVKYSLTIFLKASKENWFYL